MQGTKGRIIVITGDGKGKTTSALGRAVRAIESGKKVRMVQFLKGGGYTGELAAARIFGEDFLIYQFGHGCPISEDIRSGKAMCIRCGTCFRENRNPIHDYAGKALKKAWEFVVDPVPKLLILDEVSHAVRRDLISEAAVTELLDKRAEGVDIVLTGRNMPRAIILRADEAVECRLIKHPLKKGIAARRGIEY